MKNDTPQLVAREAHHFVKTVNWKQRRKDGKLDIHVCPYCGSYRLTDRNTLRKAYFAADNTVIGSVAPECFYDPKNAEKVKRAGLPVPPPPPPKRTLDELLQD